VNRPWTVLDFALIWLAGLLGAGLGVGMASLMEAVSVSDLVILGLAGQYVATISAFWLVARRRDIGSIGLSIEPKDIRYVALGMLLQVVVALLLFPLSNYLFPDGRPPQDIADIIASPETTTLLKMFLFVAAALFAPVIEEVLFRGVLLQALMRRGRFLAISVSSAAFAAIHMTGLPADSFLASAAVVLPPLFALGVLLCWLTLKTGRLGPAIFLHSGWNVLAALILLIPQEVLEQLETMG
jgi:uncharacterized protein